MRIPSTLLAGRRIFDSLPPLGGRMCRILSTRHVPGRNKGLTLCFFLLSTALFTSGFWSAGSYQERQVIAIRNPLVSEPGHRTAKYRSTLQAVTLDHYRTLPVSAKFTPRPELALVSFEGGRITVAGTPAGEAAAQGSWGYSMHAPGMMLSSEPLIGLMDTEKSFLQCDAGVNPLSGAARFIIPSALHLDKRAEQYAGLVTQYAAKYNLSPGLIYAIMRTESAFNPFAVSHAGALGLMQLVPDTAGSEVHSYITGRQGNPGKAILFNPDNNIHYGSTYLHLLHTRYFQGVTNPTNRQLCVIAAYNGGPGTVFRVFSSSRSQAVEAINRLTPEQLYRTLVTKLPTEENRRYVDKVLGHLQAGTFPLRTS